MYHTGPICRKQLNLQKYYEKLVSGLSVFFTGNSQTTYASLAMQNQIAQQIDFYNGCETRLSGKLVSTLAAETCCKDVYGLT